MLEQQALAVPVGHVVELDHRVAEARHLDEVGERQLVGPVGRGARPSTTARAAVDLGLRLAGAGRRPPPQPRQLGPGQVAPLVLGGGLALGPLGAGGEVGGVAAVVQVPRAPVELEDARRDPVEHVPVVGDEHEPAR